MISIPDYRISAGCLKHNYLISYLKNLEVLSNAKRKPSNGKFKSTRVIDTSKP